MTKYWKISNAEGKTWIIPLNNTRMALQLYQPSGRNGKMLKALLPFFAPFYRIWSPFPIINGPVEPGLTNFLSSFFKNKNLVFSYFLGTPCAHKKSTVQVALKKQILAYCKTSNNSAVEALFDKEKQLLDWLAESGVKHIPTCLFNNSVDGFDQRVFIMSTEKNDHSAVVHEWTVLHDAFIQNLVNCTSVECLFEESDYFQLLVGLKNRIGDLPDGVDTNLVSRVIADVIDKFEGKKLNMVAMHGDFTPWNMFRQDDHLFVFDWEYALRTSPLNLDRYHFYSQQAFFEKHWNAGKMLVFMKEKEGRWMNSFEYKMYIVLIMSVFVLREKGKCQNSDLFCYWNDLLTGL